jgi:hypothetical protein
VAVSAIMCRRASDFVVLRCTQRENETIDGEIMDPGKWTGNFAVELQDAPPSSHGEAEGAVFGEMR